MTPILNDKFVDKERGFTKKMSSPTSSTSSTSRTPTPTRTPTHTLREQIRLNRESIQNLISRTSSLRVSLFALPSFPSFLFLSCLELSNSIQMRQHSSVSGTVLQGLFEVPSRDGHAAAGGAVERSGGPVDTVHGLGIGEDKLRRRLVELERENVELREDLEECQGVLRRVTEHHRVENAARLDPKEWMGAVELEKARNKELLMENAVLKHKVNHLLSLIAEAANEHDPMIDDDDAAEYRRENSLLRGLLQDGKLAQ